MIVYGDVAYSARLSEMGARLRGQGTLLRTLDGIRAFLITAGQVEQAAADALPSDHQVVTGMHAITSQAARLLVARLDGEAPDINAISALTDGLMALTFPSQMVTVKLPKGFTFYALYPDQYVDAARRWLKDRAEITGSACRVVVAGGRSICTALVAIVSAVFERAGWHVVSLNARPTGFPLERSFAFDNANTMNDFDDAYFAVVVDEGPWLSESSLVVVAQALLETGIERERIAFFTGHDDSPSGVMREEDSNGVQEWWRSTPRYPALHGDLRFGGETLIRRLERASLYWCRYPSSGRGQVHVRNIGGGAWSSVVYGDSAAQNPGAAHVPPVFPAFEMPKYLCTMPDGLKILWKFAGLPLAPGETTTMADDAAARLRALSAYCPPLIGVEAGFVGTVWLDAVPLTRADFSADLSVRMGEYIAVAAGEPLTSDETHAALRRLKEIVYWNVHEIFGEAFAKRVGEWMEKIVTTYEPVVQTYGDGRLMPHKWLRTATGRIYKTDATGHQWDHTGVGVQSVLWDLAGAISEWSMTDLRAEPMIAAFERHSGGRRINRRVLLMYQLAYLAFRAGVCATGLSSTAHDPVNDARIQIAFDRYKAQLDDFIQRIRG